MARLCYSLKNNVSKTFFNGEYMSKRKRSESNGNGNNELNRSENQSPAQRKTSVISKLTLKALNENQKKAIKSISFNKITIITGPSGSGKTHISSVYGLMEVLRGKYKKLIITRPCVEAYGETMGFLPGDILAKSFPYITPVLDIFGEFLSSSEINKLISEGLISVVPFAFMRGNNFKNAFVVAEESQNTTPKQMHLFLTRLGENSKMVINGDLAQSDIQNNMNGLQDALQKFRNIDGIGIVEMSRQDIVRDPLVQTIVEIYEKEEREKDLPI